MKRLMIRLSIVSVVLILGVIAIWQTLQDPESSEANAEGKKEPLKPAVENRSPGDNSLGQNDSETKDSLFAAGALASKFKASKSPASTSLDSTTPSPQETIVRGNEDDDPPGETERGLAPSRFSRYSVAGDGASAGPGESPPPLVIDNASAPKDLDSKYQGTKYQGIGTSAADALTGSRLDPAQEESPLGNQPPRDGNVQAENVQAEIGQLGDSSAYSSGPAYTGPSTLGSQPPAGGELRRPLSQAPAISEQSESYRRRDFPSSLGSSRARLSSSSDLASGGALGQRRLALAGSATPGSRQLEGSQAPSLMLEKTAPDEIQINKPATFEIKVRNVGQTTAHGVVVTDQVPRGTRLLGASPEVLQSSDGSLSWKLGEMEPGAETIIALELMPEEEGEIGSVAHVAFAAQASVRTFCTRPLLTIEHSAPPKVLIGESVTLSIIISNPGSGAATGVILEENVPEGLSHEAGNELEYEIGILKPGETRKLELTLKAEKAGLIQNVIRVHGNASLKAVDAQEIEVIAPKLEVAMTGPKKRYLNRQATYTVSVSNPGTAAAKHIELVAYLPKGLKFVESNNQGQYDPNNHAVYWSLEELSPTKNGSVQLTALPVETGSQKLRVEGKADLGLSNEFEQAVEVDGLAELFFSVADLADPIEVGAETMYEVKISNKGSKIDTNIRLVVELPQGMRPINGDGPSQAAVEGQRVFFKPLSRLAPGDEVLYKIQARGVRAGDQRIRVEVVSDEAPTPVAKEENTRVYADQ